MLTGLHFILSYACTYECDHCFVYSSPRARGTFTIGRVREALQEAEKTGSISTIFLEGGEPFLYYPLMLEAAKAAVGKGFNVGIVTNGYFAVSEEDAELWLSPLLEVGVSNLTISDDALHNGDQVAPASKVALAAAERLGIPTGAIRIEEPVVGGGVMFRGRAVEKLATGLPVRNWEEFDECPHEDLDAPSRCHIDCYGNVQLCQGISIGNMWETPLSMIVGEYDAKRHPICGVLQNGGPAQLVRNCGLEHDDGYVDACHLCYSARTMLMDRFPGYLAPPQVYGGDK